MQTRVKDGALCLDLFNTPSTEVVSLIFCTSVDRRQETLKPLHRNTENLTLSSCPGFENYPSFCFSLGLIPIMIIYLVTQNCFILGSPGFQELEA